MSRKSEKRSMGRRRFLAASGVLAAASPAVAANVPGAPSPETSRANPKAAQLRVKIPIGVCDPVYKHLSVDAMLERISTLGLEAVEIGTGGYPGSWHCPVEQLLADPAKPRAWKNKFDENAAV